MPGLIDDKKKRKPGRQVGSMKERLGFMEGTTQSGNSNRKPQSFGRDMPDRGGILPAMAHVGIERKRRENENDYSEVRDRFRSNMTGRM